MKNAIKLFLLFLIVAGCKKKEEAISPNILPPRFSFEVNGEVIGISYHYVSVELIMDTSSSPGYTYRRFQVLANYGTGYAKGIYTGFTDDVSSENLIIKSYPDTVAGYYPYLLYFNANDTINNYIQMWPMTHFAITAVDNTNKKVSFTFSGILLNTVGNDTIAFSNAHFEDLYYSIRWQ